MRYFLSIAFLFILFNLSAQVNLNNGLVAYYPFNGNANDASGNNNTASLINGTTFGTDRNGTPNTAAAFDGIDDYISVQDNGVFSTQIFSIVLWFYSTSSSLQSMIGKRDYTTVSGLVGRNIKCSLTTLHFQEWVPMLSVIIQPVILFHHLVT
jgi:hypothetical protein